ncbi:hypothetical protein CLOP_g1525 [Closterium sp. NIES-67]|nr:hypothetical protein CLOP_g1525 [Closterium sp. NIES-67]
MRRRKDAAKGGDHTATAIAGQHDKANHGISEYMRAAVCFSRCGLSTLMPGEEEATTADLFYYFTVNVPKAWKRLMRAATEAGGVHTVT